MTIPEGKIQYNFDYDDWYNFTALDERHLYFNGEIEEDCIDIISTNIIRFNTEDKGKDVKDRKPIMIYLNSPGGQVSTGMGVCDIIKLSITPVYVVNLGIAMSMAFMLYIVADKRFALPNAQFLMHDGSTFIGYEASAKVRDRVEFDTEVESRIRQMVLDNTKITSELYDEKYRTEFYFLADKGKELGVVDYIIGQDCSIEDIT